ncbi:hypothetical protein MPSEU_000441500 [Mayamaea pseudoterrestris]|nr:hypothetical protein MPSEU_000441500 [Mayamaea pseudoterrestris]
MYSTYSVTMTDLESDESSLEDMNYNKTPLRTPGEKKQLEDEDTFLDLCIAENNERFLQRSRLTDQGAYKDMNDDPLTDMVSEVAQSNTKAVNRELEGLYGLYTDNALPDDELKARIEAIQTCQHERYGKRTMIQYDPARATNDNFKSFQTTDEAIAALQQIINQHVQQETSMDIDGLTRKEMTWLRRLDDVLAEGEGCLIKFLQVGRLAEVVQATDDSRAGLESVCSWLFCSALSLLPENQLAEASKQALTEIIQNGLLPQTCWFKSWTALLDCLTVWIDLIQNTLPFDEKENGKLSVDFICNVSGLEHLLSLWDKGLSRDGKISLDPAIATMITTTFLRLSLDELILDSVEHIHNILLTLTSGMKELDGAAYDSWTKTTAEAVFRNMTIVGQVPNTNYPDAQGYLTWSAMIELTPVSTGLLKVHLLAKAFECVLNIPEWRTHVLNTRPILDNRDKILNRASDAKSLSWFCLVASTVAIDILRNKINYDFADDYVRAQALLLLALSSFDVALLQWPPISSAKVPGKEYGRTTEATLMYEVLCHLESAIEAVRIATKSAQDANCRSVNYLCTVFCQYLSEAAAWAAAQGGLKVKNKVQTSAEPYFKSSDKHL